MSLDGKTILVTGATGSFGRKFIDLVLSKYDPKAIRVFSRDELKQFELQRRWEGEERLRYLIGDVRDVDRLRRAFREVDVVVHAAAMKQVTACEYNPFEAVQTNILGAENVIRAALDMEVDKVIAISSDKAVSPVNLYGATKLCAEKLFSRSNSYSGSRATRFASIRYGNVVGSRGSVIPVFKRQAEEDGRLRITDERMTRFWITLERAAEFVVSCIDEIRGGEVSVPKIPSTKIVDIAEAVAPGVPYDVVGIRPGEKLHEDLLTPSEARNTIELEDRYVILPAEPTWPPAKPWPTGKPVAEDFTYSSNTNTEWLTGEELKKVVEAASEADY